MSRESKIIKASQYSVEKTVQIYESFGWELLSLNGNQITMSRETQNPVYDELLKFQIKYEQKAEELKTITYPEKPLPPKPIDKRTCLIAFVCLIFPGVLYLRAKLQEKEKYRLAMEAYQAAVAQCEEKKAAIRAEIEQIVGDSRATFFAKR